MGVIGVSGKINSGKDTFARTWNTCLIPKGVKASEFEGYWEIRKFAGKLKETAASFTGLKASDFESDEVKNSTMPADWWYYTIQIKGIDVPDSTRYGTEEEAKGAWTGDVIKEIKLVKPTYRCLLLDLGMKMREVHPNIHVNGLFADYKPVGTVTSFGDFENTPPNWLVTDTRFQNEYQGIKDIGGIVVRIIRDTNPVIVENLEDYPDNQYLTVVLEDKHYTRFRDIRNRDLVHVWLHGAISKEPYYFIAREKFSIDHPSETELDFERFDYIIVNNTLPGLVNRAYEIQSQLKKEGWKL